MDGFASSLARLLLPLAVVGILCGAGWRLVQTGAPQRQVALLSGRGFLQPPLPTPAGVLFADESGSVRLLSPNGRTAWQHQLTDPPAAAPAVGSRHVLAASASRLTCLDLRDGRPHWAAGLGSPALAVAALSDRVVVLTAQRQLLALALDGGARLWRQPLPVVPTLGPVAVGDAVVLGLPDGKLLALDAAGSRLWATPPGQRAARYLTLASSGAWVGYDRGEVRWLTLNTGQLGPTITFPSPLTGPPAEREGWLFATTADARAYALAPDRSVYWAVDLPAAAVTGGTLAGPQLLVPCQDRTIRAIDLTDGHEVWRMPLDADISAPLARVDQRVYFGAWDGNAGWFVPDA